MAANGEVPVGDSEMSEYDGGEVVTMMDVLKEQQEFEDDANAVLGGSDEKECTYSQGYIKRQAIYACMTCCPESKEDSSKRAGFCLACSLTCHENHDLVELYTKRNFRCDCGNPKFKSSCQFTPAKPDLNDENIYNQNFVGLYCICSKPYGEQENALDDEMIQCVICEDWWHAAHLEAIVPPHDQFSEMVCKLCMAKNEFLHSYSDLAVNVESGDVDVVNTNGVDSTILNEKLTNGSVPYGNLTNGSVVDDKLTKDSIADDKLINGSEDGETIVEDNQSELNNANQAQAMETSTTEAPVSNIDEASSSETESTVINNAANDASNLKKTEETDQDINIDMSTNEAPVIEDAPVSNNDDEASSEKESILLNKTDNDVSEPKKTEETNQEISSTDAVMDTIENKVEEITSEKDSTEEKNSETNAISAVDSTVKMSETNEATAQEGEQKLSEENNELCVDKTENDLTEEKISETNAISAVDSTVKMAETNEATAQEGEEKLSEENIDKPATDFQPTEFKNNDSSVHAIADNINTELPAEIESSSQLKSKEQEKVVIDNVDTTNTKVVKSDDQDTQSTEAVDETSTAKQEDTNIAVSEAVDSSMESERINNIETEESVVPETVTTEKRKLLVEDAEDSPAKKPKINGKQCIRPKSVKKVHRGATFWPSDFRQKLCTCNECISMYKDLSVLFLTDMEDTVTAYETLGKERTAGKPNQYEKGIEALCSLGRIQQIDALTEYNKMRDKLLTFLQSFKEKKEIVTEHDIKTFFAGMKPEKRNDGVYFCG